MFEWQWLKSKKGLQRCPSISQLKTDHVCFKIQLLSYLDTELRPYRTGRRPGCWPCTVLAVHPASLAYCAPIPPCPGYHRITPALATPTPVT